MFGRLGKPHGEEARRLNERGRRRRRGKGTGGESPEAAVKYATIVSMLVDEGDGEAGLALYGTIRACCPCIRNGKPPPYVGCPCCP